MGGEYVAIEIEELPDGSLQGYSALLNLNIRWERGELVFHDPITGRPILTYEDQRARGDHEQARADTAEARATTEQEARTAAESRADIAEARVHGLEELLRRRDP